MEQEIAEKQMKKHQSLKIARDDPRSQILLVIIKACCDDEHTQRKLYVANLGKIKNIYHIGFQ
jgi:hypothetical protein